MNQSRVLEILHIKPYNAFMRAVLYTNVSMNVFNDFDLFSKDYSFNGRLLLTYNFKILSKTLIVLLIQPHYLKNILSIRKSSIFVHTAKYL